jgi:protein TonB
VTTGQPKRDRTFLRFVAAAILGAGTAFALFWVMQALISVTGVLNEGGKPFSVDFVRLKRDTTPEQKKREKPQREKPEQQPPPPDIDMSNDLSPGDVVGGIVPDVDLSHSLEKATSLGTGGGSDRDVVPLVRVDPTYPPRAKQRGIEGFVLLEFSITPVGTVTDARVIHAEPAFVFDRAALRAVRKYRYNPKVENGTAVARKGIKLKLTFTLPKGGR